MTRSLVIGGTLFIGRRLVERLLERGDDVTVLHRSAGTPFGSGIREIRCDRNDPVAVRAALLDGGFEVVYDNVYDWGRGTPSEPVAAAARAAAAGPLRRYVFLSSVAAYGYGSNLDEQAPLAPPDHPNPYARDKAASERALLRLHGEAGVPVTTLRPAFVYGSDNPFEREAFFWDRIVRDRKVIVPDDGARPMQWVSAPDVARAQILATERDVAVGASYNLGGPPISQAGFVEALARAAGRAVRLVPVPRERLEAMGGGVLDPPLYFGAYLDVPPITMRGERARADLGLDLTPLDDGLRETFAWYRRQRRPDPDFSWEDRVLAEAVAL